MWPRPIEVRAVVEQLGGGAFAPSAPGGAPWHPVAAMIRAANSGRGRLAPLLHLSMMIPTHFPLHLH